jgi:hypothetical protein
MEIGTKERREESRNRGERHRVRKKGGAETEEGKRRLKGQGKVHRAPEKEREQVHTVSSRYFHINYRKRHPA